VYYWQPRHNWIKYVVIALIIHGAVLSLPVSRNVPHVLKDELIDVVLMRQEPAPPPPVVEKLRPKPAPGRVALKETAPAPRVKEQVPAALPKPREQGAGDAKPLEPQPLEKKAGAAGAGNVIDEQTASQVLPAPGPAEGEGVGVAGVNTAGGKVGLGGGGTGTGAGGVGTGTGSGGGGLGGGGAGGVVRLREPPAFAYFEKPEYPARARRLGKEGKVVLQVTIDEKGNVVKVDVDEATDQMFVANSVSAAKRWKFHPYKKDGVPVACRAQQPLSFRLQE